MLELYEENREGFQFQSLCVKRDFKRTRNVTGVALCFGPALHLSQTQDFRGKWRI